MEYSPALSVNSDLTEEELDKYFACYVPLSNLPTPPPKEHAIPNRASPAPSPPSQTHDNPNASVKTIELQAHATHLANLVPLNVSTHRPHATVIRGFLERASLPDEIVAFSACILDALSSRFAATWRDALAPADYARDLKNFLRTDSRQHVHVSPDVIVLAALALAHGFLVDRVRSTQHWAVHESDGSFTVQDIETTKRAILHDMDYGLFRISDDRVQRRLRAMHLTLTASMTNVASDDKTTTAAAAAARHDRRHNLSLSLTGTGVWSHGVQTPEPSP